MGAPRKRGRRNAGQHGSAPSLPASASRWSRIRLLPQSGQALTFLVQRRDDGTRGVLKAPQGTPAQTARLKREVATLSSIDHPAVVRLLDYHVDTGPIWLITPEGTPFPRWWNEHGSTLAPEARADLARHIALALLDGLAVVHASGIVHRDIKPGNVVMFDVQPALIDFGLAYVVDAERLTAIDDRAVANRFAAPPAAYYGQVDDPKPWWDCLGIAWLWGWMLADGRGPKDFRFHWKYHRMLPCDDAEGVRALVAVCSDEATAPPDAQTMRDLLERLRLTERGQGPAVGSEAGGFAEIAALDAKNRRAEMLRYQDRREHVLAAASALAVIYEPVRNRLITIAEEARDAGLPVDTRWSGNRAPIERALSRLAGMDEPVKLFDCECRPAAAHAFTVILKCEYRPWKEELWPLRFILTIEPGPPDLGTDVVHQRDGAALGDFGKTPIDGEYLPKVFAQWLHDKENWERTIW